MDKDHEHVLEQRYQNELHCKDCDAIFRWKDGVWLYDAEATRKERVYAAEAWAR